MWVHHVGNGRMVYSFYDDRFLEDDPSRTWCRKHGIATLIEPRGELSFDFLFDHTVPAEEVDYTFYVEPIPEDEALSDRPNFWLIWDWTKLDHYDESMREEITIPCELCTKEPGGYGD